MSKGKKYALIALATMALYFGTAHDARADQFVTLTAQTTGLVGTPGSTIHIATTATNLMDQAFTIEDRVLFSRGVGVLLVFDGYVLDPAPLPLTGGRYQPFLVRSLLLRNAGCRTRPVQR
jgi:hypothetical protein